MNLRTDLALERCESLDKRNMRGVNIETVKKRCAKVSRIEVVNEEGAQAIGKPIGRYINVEVTPFARHAQFIDGSLGAVSEEIASLLPPSGSVLVAGLGNSRITPDALGPKCASMIFATRHITGELLRATGLGKLRTVSAFATGVLGETGAEAGEMLKGLVDTLRPEAVITVDEETGMDPAKAGAYIASVAMREGHHHPLYAIRFDYKFFTFLAKVLPARFLNWLIYCLYGK